MNPISRAGFVLAAILISCESISAHDVNDEELKVSAAAFQCPYPWGNFPHETSCRHYYRCNRDRPSLRTCNGDQYFSPLSKRCTRPEFAGCQLPTTTRRPRNITTVSPIHNGTTTWRNSTEPSKVTPHYNVTTTKLPFTDNSTTVTERPANPVTDANAAFECPKLDGMFGHEFNCSLFYHCSNGIVYVKNCPAMLQWNSHDERCDWPENSDCGRNSSPNTENAISSTTQLVNISAVNFTCPQENGLYKNPRDCRSFYHCSNSVAYLKDCPDILHWSESAGRCEWPDKANCSINDLSDVTSTTMSATIRPENVTSTTMAYEEKTTQSKKMRDRNATNIDNDKDDHHNSTYIDISTSTAMSREQSSVYFQNVTSTTISYDQRTIRPENVTATTMANDETTTHSANITEKNATTIDNGKDNGQNAYKCDCDSNDGDESLDLNHICGKECTCRRLVTHPYVCNKYIDCYNRIGNLPHVVRRCPPGLQFNANTLTCDYRGNVNCRQ